MMLRHLTILIVFISFPNMVFASETVHDSRPLTANEIETFIPLLCQNPVKNEKEHHCDKVIGYPDFYLVDNRENTLSLDAISYGAFTQAKADEAYLSYTASFEPHADNFGGGILFERVNDKWKLIRWYQGGQMNDCLAFFVNGQQNMLCLTGYMGQGRVDSFVSVFALKMNNSDFLRAQIKSILEAEDGRGRGPGNDNCEINRTKDEAILLSVAALQRSQIPDFFAEAFVTYAKPEDIAKACEANNYESLKETKDTVRFILHNGEIEAVTPTKFKKLQATVKPL
jgi:hypothetical protein